MSKYRLSAIKRHLMPLENVVTVKVFDFSADRDWSVALIARVSLGNLVSSASNRIRISMSASVGRNHDYGDYLVCLADNIILPDDY